MLTDNLQLTLLGTEQSRKNAEGEGQVRVMIPQDLHSGLRRMWAEPQL